MDRVGLGVWLRLGLELGVDGARVGDWSSVGLGGWLGFGVDGARIWDGSRIGLGG